ncbi:MAG: alpha-1,2-fucosyltransferase [Butyrivibrio sp.]|nr:alpha-1,2-fucosyltransferase [Butyrivibrio sp.]
MLVICIGDGLGNQMFQYAFYYAIKKRYPDNRVTVDICNYYGSVNKHNGYELERVFGIHLLVCDERTASVLADFIPNSRHKIMNKLFQARRVLFGNKESFITQDDPTVYYQEVFELNRMKSYMFRGNWINEDYFRDYREEILKDFTFVQDIDEKNASALQQMEKENTVSIHVRRGDYLQTKMTHLGKDYYAKAVALIEKKVENPVFYIFSDDIEYIRQEFDFIKEGQIVIVDWNKGRDSFRDMQLMSCCKHNIIANSTFSFWGAYLNRYEKRIIIAPAVAAAGYRNPFACKEWILI